MKSILGMIALALAVCASNAFARPSDSWQTTCGDIPGVQKGKYCFHQTGPSPKYTIWFFHGVSDSEKIFLQSNLNQDSYIEFTEGLPAVNIVTVSYGFSWILTDYPNRTEKPVNATLDVFRSQVVPFIENKFKPVKPYAAMGHSEGGISVANLCAGAPDMWSSCVLLNPLLPTCDPFAKRNCNHWGVNLLIKENYSEAGWKATQPLVLLEQTGSMPRSFVTACSSDQWKLFTGPKAWSDRAVQLGFESHWAPVTTKCDHSHWPAGAVLEFLSAP